MDHNWKQTPRSCGPWGLDQKMTRLQMVSSEGYTTAAHIIIRNILELTVDNLQTAE